MGDITFAISRLENPLADLRQLEDGNLPPRRNIEYAPLIDRWGEGMRASPCHFGKVTGTPFYRAI